MTGLALAVIVALAALEFPLSRTLLVLCCALLVLALLINGQRYTLPWPLGLFLAWCVLTTIWSAAPLLTLKGCAKIGFLISAVSLATNRLGTDRTLDCVRRAGKLLLIIGWGI